MEWLHVISILFIFGLFNGSVSVTTDRNEIIIGLLQGASALKVPSTDDQPVKVTVLYTISSVRKADTELGEVDIVVWLNLSWMDKALVWSRMCTSFEDISIPSDKIWTPDLSVFNSVGTPDIYSSNQLRVSKNGTVLQMLKLHVLVPCDITQLSGKSGATPTCGLKMGSWTRSTQEMVLEGEGPAHMDAYIPGSKFKVLNATQRINRATDPYGSDTFEDAELVFTFKRLRA